MSDMKWFFPAAHGQDYKGDTEGDTSTMRLNPLTNLTREMIQNSIDARNRKDNHPVFVEFKLFYTSIEAFPGYQAFSDELNAAKEAFELTGETDRRRKMEEMLSCFESERIQWLRVSDFHTTGLCGVSTPFLINKPWTAFTKGSGYSTKGGKDAGSQGVGKNSAFINSKIRTIFVSTKTIENEIGYQGLSKLISHQLSDSDYTRGLGYFGLLNDEMPLPVNEVLNLDSELNRQENGTDIFIPFFEAKDEFTKTIESVAIESFLPAIIGGKLEISIDGELITSEKIDDIIQKVYRNQNGKNALMIREIYETIKGKEVQKFLHSDKSGECDMLLYLNAKQGENHSNQIMVYREPGIRVNTFQLASDVPYFGVLVIKGENLIRKVKPLENATHTKWIKSSLTDTSCIPFTKDIVLDTYEEIRDFLEEKIKTLSNDVKGARVSFGGTDDFSVENDSDFSEIEKKEVLPSVKTTVTHGPKRKKHQVAKSNKIVDESSKVKQFDIGEGQPDSEGEEIGSHPMGHNNNKSEDPIPHGGEAQDNVSDGFQKMMMSYSVLSAKKTLHSFGGGDFELIFKPEVSGNDVHILINKVGCDGSNESVKILSVKGPLFTNCSASGNIIKLNKIKKNTIYKIKLTLDVKHNYAWEVTIHGHTK